ncbi:MAG: fumarate hydratase [Bacillota bacterium]
MREIAVHTVREAVKELCIESNLYLPSDVKCALERSLSSEKNPRATIVLDKILQNVDIAQNEQLPLCQDTGMLVVFLEIGQDVHFVGGGLTEAIQSGVEDGYRDGFLRKSIVADPLERVNTKTNTPAVIYTDIVEGDAVKIIVAPKGFGSENMSRIQMCRPSDGAEGIKHFIVESVRLADANPCPPIVVGVGIGSTFEGCALLAKKALLRPLDAKNENPFYAKMEEELLETINGLNIGPQGFGGETTALGVNILAFPTHIAGMPVAVNISCHVARHKERIL